jgi:hypothetical protein
MSAAIDIYVLDPEVQAAHPEEDPALRQVQVSRRAKYYELAHFQTVTDLSWPSPCLHSSLL